EEVVPIVPQLFAPITSRGRIACSSGRDRAAESFSLGSTEAGREPALCHRHVPSLAAGVVLHLLPVDLAETEVLGLRMGEIQARYGGARPHGKAFRELDAGAALRIQQPEQSVLLRVIGLGRIAGRGTNALVFL